MERKAFIDYKLYLKKNSRRLRTKSTLGEVLLWKKLRAGTMMGYKFNRQKPLGNYIVDFYCKKLKLIIEVDGSSHNNRYAQDMDRQKKLEAMGLTVLRFADIDVKKDMNNVLRALEIFILEFEGSDKSPLPPF